jgi:hypothetical protein
MVAIRAGRDSLSQGGAMSGGFAGSQRVDERRRRRLAAVDDSSAVVIRPQAAQRPYPLDDLSSPTSDLSLAGLVPTSWWRQLVLCLTGFVATAGVLSASVHSEELSRTLGADLTGLLIAQSGTLRGWWITLSLLFQAQLALVIFWVRSQSLRDFEGRYHLWTRVAAAAVLWSCCASTSAHVLAGELVSRGLRGTLGLSTEAGWILPAAGLAALLTWGLHREMTACRGSDVALWLAGVCGAVFAVLTLNPSVLPSQWGAARGLILDGLTMSGIWLVCVSFLIHARYVIHLSAEPVPVKRWSFRMPRPHWGRFGWKRPIVPDSETGADGDSGGEAGGGVQGAKSSSTGRRTARAKPSRTRKPAAASPELDSSSAIDASECRDDVPTEETARPVSRTKLRFDAIEVTPTSGTDLVPTEVKPSAAELGRATSPKAVPNPPRPTRGEDRELDEDDEEPSRSSAGSGRSDLHSIERDSGRAFTSPHLGGLSDDEPAEADEDAADSSGDEGDSSDLSGLSKKQRRKLLAQQRERDRERQSKRR